MTAKNRSDNKAAFETGDAPTGTNYADLIDSFLSITDSTAQSVASDITVPNITVETLLTLEGSTTVLSTAQTSAIWQSAASQGAHKLIGLVNITVGTSSYALMYTNKGTFL